MSEFPTDLADGTEIDCCAVFVSKRTTTVGGTRVFVLTLEADGDTCRLVLDETHASLARGWRFGRPLEVDSALVWNSDELRRAEKDCPECGRSLWNQRVVASDDVSPAVRTVVDEIDDVAGLLATPETTVEDGCSLDVPWREIGQATPAGLTCTSCGRKFDSQF